VGAAAAIIAVGYFSVRDAGYVEPIEYYRVLEPQQIAVGTYTGNGVWTRVADVTETESTIAVVVKTWMIPFMTGPAVAFPVELTVSLDEPVDGRAVTDSNTGYWPPNREVPRLTCGDLEDPWRTVASC
jgi:hypothetical protein